MKSITRTLITIILGTTCTWAGAKDNGVPASEAAEWKEIFTDTTGSRWRTKANEKTGEKITYNPFTSEIWRNPVTGKAEAVLREEWEDIQSSSTPSSNVVPAKPSGLVNGTPYTVTPQIPKQQAPKPYYDNGNITRSQGWFLPEVEVPAQSNGSSTGSGANDSYPKKAGSASAKTSSSAGNQSLQAEKGYMTAQDAAKMQANRAAEQRSEVARQRAAEGTRRQESWRKTQEVVEESRRRMEQSRLENQRRMEENQRRLQQQQDQLRQQQQQQQNRQPYSHGYHTNPYLRH